MGTALRAAAVVVVVPIAYLRRSAVVGRALFVVALRRAAVFAIYRASAAIVTDEDFIPMTGTGAGREACEGGEGEGGNEEFFHSALIDASAVRLFMRF